NDPYLASFVLSEGGILADCIRISPKKVEFRFVADLHVHSLLRLYWSGMKTSLVPGRLFAALQQLKSRSFITREDACRSSINFPLPSMSILSTLRQTTQPSPAKFLEAQSGCWIQYYDDTRAKDTAKALSVRSFDPDVARGKQEQRCAVCFSLQEFGDARTKEGLVSYRNLGVDVDLISAQEHRTLSPEAIDRRKDDYLTGCLLSFPLKPHW